MCLSKTFKSLKSSGFLSSFIQNWVFWTHTPIETLSSKPNSSRKFCYKFAAERFQISGWLEIMVPLKVWLPDLSIKLTMALSPLLYWKRAFLHSIFTYLCYCINAKIWSSLKMFFTKCTEIFDYHYTKMRF